MLKIIFLALSLFLVSQAHAYVLPLSSNLAAEVLSESVPTAFAINDWTVNDFALEWVSLPGQTEIPGLRAELEQNSLEWVRVNDVLVLPRARVILNANSLEGGRVMNAGFSQGFTRTLPGAGEAKLPIALISGPGNPIDVVLKKGGKEYRGRLQVKFEPRRSGPRIFVDPSCSKFGFNARALEIPELTPPKNSLADSWTYIGCRLVQTEAFDHRTSSLEAFLFWDNIRPEVEIGGIRTPATSYAVWALRLRADSGEVQLNSGARIIELTYQVPQQFHRGSISLGLGPYSYFFRNSSEETSNMIIMPTFYASYAVSETMRIVAFDATTLNKQNISDLGIYVNSEYIRTLDRRLALNLMLGVHFIGFKDRQYFFKVGAPQGVEMIYTDFLQPGRNLSLGGFIYPAIQGKSYYNTWIRWGSSQLFGEVNYISWEERINEMEFSARSLGITLGFPIPFLRFL